MGNMLQRAKTILRPKQPLTALYDKGYHTGSEFCTAEQLNINTLVAIPGVGRSSQAPNPDYNVEHFQYNKETDTYTCPEQQILTSNGNWYKGRNYKFKQYKTKACKDCPMREQCTTAKVNGKIVQRSEYAQYVENNAQRVAESGQVYKKRQALVEHPFGTIKRQWGFDYIMTKKGIKQASADFGFIALVYNLKRLINILGIQMLLKEFNTLINRLLRIILSLQRALTHEITYSKDNIKVTLKTQKSYFAKQKIVLCLHIVSILMYF
jgi:hypothetical protein